MAQTLTQTILPVGESVHVSGLPLHTQFLRIWKRKRIIATLTAKVPHGEVWHIAESMMFNRATLDPPPGPQCRCTGSEARQSQIVSPCLHRLRKPYYPQSTVGDESDYQSWCQICGQILRDEPNR
jgi:hypothetical protein